MISQDEIQEFNREKRDYIGNDSFAVFVAWRQMRALNALAEAVSKLAEPQTFNLAPDPRHSSVATASEMGLASAQHGDDFDPQDYLNKVPQLLGGNFVDFPVRSSDAIPCDTE